MAIPRPGPLSRFCRAFCWIVLAGCFSPSQEEKNLVTLDDNAVAGATKPGAGTSTSASGSEARGADAGALDAAAGTSRAPTPEAGLDASSPTRDAGGTAPDAASTADPSADPPLLFPKRCKAPWEETSKYHPAGYDAAKVHGLESNLNKDNCASCHGDKLDGCANSPSCDNCHDGGHPKDWRKNCIYCHGGLDNKLGAPPRDLDGKTTKSELSFIAHTLHVTKERHLAYGCETCHKKYEDALDPGHMYDDTPGESEVAFDGGLSKAGMYLGDGKCANLYCHGTGKALKNVEHTATKLACTGCHSDAPTTGQHATHSFGFDCAECHGRTVSTSLTITGPDFHVNGKVDLDMPDNNMKWDGSTCNGVCHVLVSHVGDKW